MIIPASNDSQFWQCGELLTSLHSQLHFVSHCTFIRVCRVCFPSLLPFELFNIIKLYSMSRGEGYRLVCRDVIMCRSICETIREGSSKARHKGIYLSPMKIRRCSRAVSFKCRIIKNAQSLIFRMFVWSFRRCILRSSLTRCINSRLDLVNNRLISFIVNSLDISREVKGENESLDKTVGILIKFLSVW